MKPDDKACPATTVSAGAPPPKSCYAGASLPKVSCPVTLGSTPHFLADPGTLTFSYIYDGVDHGSVRKVGGKVTACRVREGSLSFLRERRMAEYRTAFFFLFSSGS